MNGMDFKITVAGVLSAVLISTSSGQAADKDFKATNPPFSNRDALEHCVAAEGTKQRVACDIYIIAFAQAAGMFSTVVDRAFNSSMRACIPDTATYENRIGEHNSVKSLFLFKVRESERFCEGKGDKCLTYNINGHLKSALNDRFPCP